MWSQHNAGQRVQQVQHTGIGKPTLLVEHRQTIDEQLELRPVVEQHAVGNSMRMSANRQVLQVMLFDKGCFR